ncbi:MAG: DUF4114 domain-containing protein [Leptolyngbya sp.]|nr:DUF4114 domain-containing protein [Leptolyngbya sp.]
MAVTTLSAALVANPAQAISLTPAQHVRFNSYVQTESKAFTNIELRQAKPTSLRLRNNVDPLEIYFINEGAGYRNQLLFSVNDGPLQMIFSDVSSPDSILKNANGPLRLGEGRSLGAFVAGTTIDFFINSNGYSRGETATTATQILGANAEENSDRQQHMVAYFVDEWVLFGFEDIVGGGDLDYNDVVFVARGLTGEAVVTPEPGILLGLLGLSGWGLWNWCQRRRYVSTPI